MEIQGRTVLVLGGFGLVGMAACRELLTRRPAHILVHSLKAEEARQACEELQDAAGETRLTPASGDIFALSAEADPLELAGAQVRPLAEEDLPDFLLYQLLTAHRPQIVVDCVNTATAIAYQDLHRAAERVWSDLDRGQIGEEGVRALLEALYIPRLIRHLQILYRGMTAAGTRAYMKVGTTGTGGMGLNVPYTHSEENPSRVLLSKSAIAGAHSMLLFLMARTPGAPITKEIKPAAAVAWKRISAGPIRRRGVPVKLVEASAEPLGETFSSFEPGRARDTGEVLETVFIDTGENGLFSLEEFALITTARQMEFVTPEEIAQYLVFEIEGGSTGHDVINALDNAVLGPTYRAGVLRHTALERMVELEKDQTSRSVAFEMLGPPRISKLLFEAHLLREAFGAMKTVRESAPEVISARLAELLQERPRLAREIISVGIPILLPSGDLLRGEVVAAPANLESEPVTPEKRDRWAESGWVDLRPPNCRRWIERFETIHREVESIPPGDTSSRLIRDRSFWQEDARIEPGKLAGWILSFEDRGARIKR